MSDNTDFYKGLYEKAQEEIASLRDRDDDAMELSMNMNEKLLDEINVLEDKLLQKNHHDTTLIHGVYQTYGWITAQQMKRKGFPPLIVMIHYIEGQVVVKHGLLSKIYKNEKYYSLVQEIFTRVMKLLAPKCDMSFKYETIPYSVENNEKSRLEMELYKPWKGSQIYWHWVDMDDGVIIKKSINLKYEYRSMRHLTGEYEIHKEDYIIDWGHEWWDYWEPLFPRATTNNGQLF